jgi:DNA (cytosine-5)-methyltransferase 1
LQFDEIPDEAMLRTPSAIEGQGGAIREDVARAKNRMLMVRDQMAQLAQENGLKVSPALLPTPLTRDHKDGSAAQTRNGKVSTDTISRTIFNSGEINNENLSWGKFEPAIRRWEAILGRSAPDPTEPSGKDGAHRLSPALCEWMMGLPEKWIVGHGLKRAEELKLAGNGVCPQQAILALTLLTRGIDI